MIRPALYFAFILCAIARLAHPVLAEEASVDELAVEAVSHPEDLRLSLWATSEQLSNPVAFTFDNKGRMFLCETFRQNKGVEDNRSHMDWLDDDLAAQTVDDRLAYFRKHLGDEISLYEEEEDRITIIADEDGDGKADRDWVFADGFNHALTGTGAGVLVHGNDVYYTCIPDLWKITDDDGDGLADKQQALHHGYGVRVAFRGHDSHGLVIGPDGRIYFSIGDRGYNIRTEDGRHWKDPESGAVFRCELDGSGLEVYATGLRNPQELAFDDAGNLFTGDNNSDSGDMARWVHVIEGGETGWRMAFQYLSDRGPWNREKLWHPRHEGQAAYIIPPIVNFADGPSGLAYYPGTGLGKEYKGTFFLCDFRGDAAISGVRSFKMKPNGASFEMSDDKKFLWNLLATDIDFGPDGGLYATDWIEGWEGVNRGRVVRVEHPEHAGSKQVQNVRALLARDISNDKAQQLARRLGNPDRRVRMKMQLELAKRESVWALVKLAASADKGKLARMHAIWALGHIGRATGNDKKRARIEAALPALVTAKHAEVRAAAVTVMGDLGSPSFSAALVEASQDRNPRVRSLAAIAIGKVGDATSREAVVRLIESNNDRDVVIRHGGVMGLVGTATESELAAFAKDSRRSVRLAAVLAMRRLKSPRLADFLEDQDEFVVLEAARAIHDVPVYEAMPALAKRIAATNEDEALMRRVLNANFRAGGAAEAKAIAAVLVSAASDVIKLEVIDMLAMWATPSSRDRVLGMWRPLESRSADPAIAALRDILSRDATLGNASAAVVVRVVEVAAKLGISEVSATIRGMISGDAVTATQRAVLLEALVALQKKDAIDVVSVASGDSSPVVRSKARDLLFSIDRSRGLSQLVDAVNAEETIERQSALAKLAELSDAAAVSAVRDLAAKLTAGTVPVDTHLDVMEAARKMGLEDQTAAFAESLKSQPHGVRRLAMFGGNVERGEEIFFNKVSLSCLRCHSVADEGGRVGPNLAGIGKDKTPEYLLQSILDPNARIAEGFGTLIVVTDDGLQHQGVVRKEMADMIHMIDADGKRFHIIKDEIIARKNGKSAMPEDLATKINDFELRDLVAYLVSLKTPWVEDTGHEE